MARLPRYIAVCLALWICFPEALAAADSTSFPTDADLVKRAIGDAIRSVLPQLPLNKDDRVILKPRADHDNNWMVQEALTQALLEEGVQVVRGSPDSAHADRQKPHYTLSFRIGELWLNYTHHKAWFRSKMTYREAGASFALTLTAPPKETVIWAQRLHARTDDVVPAKAEQLLGDSSILEPHVLDKESRWLEGIVVLGLVTGFVYLSF